MFNNFTMMDDQKVELKIMIKHSTINTVENTHAGAILIQVEKEVERTLWYNSDISILFGVQIRVNHFEDCFLQIYVLTKAIVTLEQRSI